MTKKILSIVLAILMLATVAMAAVSCGSDSKNPSKTPSKNPSTPGAATSVSTPSSNTGDVDYSNVKIGFIFLHDETSTYDKNFMDAATEMKATLGLKDSQMIFKTNVPEGAECYDAASDLVDQGCNIIFADSFGHEPYMLQAAKENKEVQFCHATGTNAHTEKLSNFHNAFASIYEGRYLAGIAAGMKLNAMIAEGKITAEQAKMGYVGAFPFAEVKSGYTSFYLGAKSVCPTVTMEVSFTDSWYSVDDERNTANSLIDRGCVLISQHADSMGAPSACESRNVPNVSYNGSTVESCPNTAIVSSRINWEPYFEYIVNCLATGKTIATDWTGTIANGAVQLTAINEAVAAEGTAAAIEAAKAKLISGELKVFDTATFTVDGKTLTNYKADVDSDDNYTPDTEVISDGYFHESEYRSAPYFDIAIDGITDLSKS